MYTWVRERRWLHIPHPHRGHMPPRVHARVARKAVAKSRMEACLLPSLLVGFFVCGCGANCQAFAKWCNCRQESPPPFVNQSDEEGRGNANVARCGGSRTHTLNSKKNLPDLMSPSSVQCMPDRPNFSDGLGSIPLLSSSYFRLHVPKD